MITVLQTLSNITEREEKEKPSRKRGFDQKKLYQIGRGGMTKRNYTFHLILVVSLGGETSDIDP